ncbi:MAG: efflux RND transporter periplasmic adaptor subunit [Hyphomicrobiales bacterium]
MQRNVRATIGCFLLVGILLLLGLIFFRDGRNGASSFRLAPVERGSITSAVITTGTLNAVITVLVGSQVSGQIQELLADFNSEVQAGQIIARIDPETFAAKVRQAEAELAVSKANVDIQRTGVERAQKDLVNGVDSLNSAKAQAEKSRVTLANSRRNRDRRLALYKSGAVSESQTDDAQTLHDQSQAQLNSAEAEERAAESLVASRAAALKSARAQVDYALEQVHQKEAALNQAVIDFEHTFIRSPVDGVVIERAVDVGQTVAASLQAPKLFTIAQDLRQMQVETDVDEADIGRVVVGHPAVFSVDAYPGREFTGKVLQIRMAPRNVQNVVTYTVVVSADNPDKRLMPGMTANIQIITAKRQDILKVPNAALRFRPASEESRPPRPSGDARTASSSSTESNPGDERLAQWTTVLNLSESQQNQARVILADARDKLSALRRQGAGPEEVRSEANLVRERSRRAIAALLTPEQQEKFRRLSAAHESNPTTRGRVYVPGENGQPAAVDIVLGLSDGTFTEVVSGDLMAGQEVIIGSQPAGQKPSGRAPTRFGFL